MRSKRPLRKKNCFDVARLPKFAVSWLELFYIHIVLVWEYSVKVEFLVESAGTAQRNLKHEITELLQIRVYYNQRKNYVTASDFLGFTNEVEIS